jgi:hypothetical protein
VTNRRSLLRASAATWLGAWLAIAKGQNVIRRVALLGIADGPNPNVELFRSRLGELGWLEQSNLVLDRRATHGDGARIAPLTAELLALRPDVFVAPFDTMAIAAAASTATVRSCLRGNRSGRVRPHQIARPTRSERYRLQRRRP